MFKFASVETTSFEGITPSKTMVEVHISNGIPSFITVGLADKSISEAKERVRSALYSSGFSLPVGKIVVNLSPASKEKEGTHYDLAIALAILKANKLIEMSDNYIILGELALNGDIVAVCGVLPAAISAMHQNKTLICSKQNYEEARLCDKLNIICGNNLLELIKNIKHNTTCNEKIEGLNNSNTRIPFAGIVGQDHAKLAMVYAVVGGHHSMFIGPQGVGKSSIASCVPELMPDLNIEESLEVTSIYSIAGMLKDGGLIKRPPFRAPHSSSSLVAIIGGGQQAKPGEISLAHNGVLFLDELPEFQQRVIDSLRAPIEEGVVHISRSRYKVVYPSSIQLIASLNPCRCGMLFTGQCRCIKGGAYINKISAPIMDRIDIKVLLERVNFHDIEKPFPDHRETIKQAILMQEKRFKKRNSKASADELKQLGKFTEESINALRNSCEKHNTSIRGFFRTMALARTIADVEGSEFVEKTHINQATWFRGIHLGI